MNVIAIFFIVMFIMFLCYIFGYIMGLTRRKTKKKNKLVQMLYCFECEIEMPTKEKHGRLACAQCGLYH